jgi:enamine deaminase RidA (YjgF/YER057c/UK114 family)
MIQRIESGKTMSRAVVRDGLIYFSGHVAGGKQATMKEQATALFKRYDELLAQYGSRKDHVLFASIYITDMALKQEFNEVWSEWMNEGNTPARVCLEVGLEDGYLVEMTLIAEVV